MGALGHKIETRAKGHFVGFSWSEIAHPCNGPWACVALQQSLKGMRKSAHVAHTCSYYRSMKNDPEGSCCGLPF